MEPIFQNYSPMSPVHDEVMESLDNQLEFKLRIIDDLVKEEEKEMAALEDSEKKEEDEAPEESVPQEGEKQTANWRERRVNRLQGPA